jgi:uncharacterized protein YccT (UPF0319 family)
MALGDRLHLINRICEIFESDQENATVVFRVIHTIAAGAHMTLISDSPVAISLKEAFSGPVRSCLWNHVTIIQADI